MDAILFHLGESIYLRQRPDTVGMVTGIIWRPNGYGYYVTWSNDMVERFHYEIELTKQKGFVTVED